MTSLKNTTLLGWVLYVRAVAAQHGYKTNVTNSQSISDKLWYLEQLTSDSYKTQQKIVIRSPGFEVSNTIKKGST